MFFMVIQQTLDSLDQGIIPGAGRFQKFFTLAGIEIQGRVV